MIKQRSSINGEVLLLCERLDMAQFMQAYLRHLFKKGSNPGRVQIINYQSLDRLKELTGKLEQEDKDRQVRKAVLFADAACELAYRNGLLSAVRSSTYFQKMEYCSHFLFPGKEACINWRKGYLEDMLLQSLRQESAESTGYHNLYNISEEYLFSVNNCRGREQKLENHSRHLLYTYLAGTSRYVGLRLGEAALQGAFDLEHACFASLKRCMEDLH